uniref:Sulfotransferase n=1 Tax=Cynoglossus semilaevis TaxID=244447 RepID=A0A3P8UZV3_CYNSE
MLARGPSGPRGLCVSSPPRPHGCCFWIQDPLHTPASSVSSLLKTRTIKKCGRLFFYCPPPRPGFFPFFFNPIKGFSWKLHVIIMATTRTGSSFVGEFFNQEKENMFYLFEPLWHVINRYSLLSDQINWFMRKSFQDVLQGLFHCDFSPMEKFIKPTPVDHITQVLFRRVSSYSLCSDPVCTPQVKRDFQRHCGPLNLTLASESCRSKKNVVIKTVRVEQLDTLRPLVEDPHLDLKIIQLVRDPRSLLISNMVTFFSGYKALKALAEYGEESENKTEVKILKGNCDKIRASAEMALSRPPWLKNNYMLVRYEDVARDPVKKAEEMLTFAGIPFSPQVREWILANTQSTDQHSGAYSTKRNASEQIDKWRVNIPLPVVQLVQKVCGPTMELFGYKFVDDEKTLLNTSISLLEEKQFDLFNAKHN